MPVELSLDQAMSLETFEITDEIRRLEHSISHLKRSNDELLEYLGSSADVDGDDDCLKEAIVDNDFVIRSQEGRIETLQQAYQQRTGLSFPLQQTSHAKTRNRELIQTDDGANVSGQSDNATGIFL